MSDDLDKLWHEAFYECAAFVRDTTLPSEMLEMYQVGRLLKEPTFRDASYKIGGFVAPHRFLIISSYARCLDEVAESPWGLCIWQRGTFFKIIDRIVEQDRVQITLLDIPEGLLQFFPGEELSELEQSFAMQARRTFDECINADPIPELDNDEWRDRLTYPIGIDDQGSLFPLGLETEEPCDAGVQFEIVGNLPTREGDVFEIADEIRRGDLVWFERVAPNKLAMRVVSSEGAELVCPKFRVDRGSQPGAIKLTELTE